MRKLGKEIGIDLGTTSVLVYVNGKGLLLQEPSVVAVDKQSGRPLKVGSEAENLLSQTPGNLVGIRPLRHGVISDYQMTSCLLKECLQKTAPARFFKPRVVICVPSGVTEVEARAVVDVGMQAGARHVQLIEEPLAAAIGMGVDINTADGHMVVDIGGGTCDIAVLSLSEIVESSSIPVAGDQFDEAIVNDIRRNHRLLIGKRAAETLKCSIGCVCPRPEELHADVKGRCLDSGLPKSVSITSTELAEAVKDVTAQIANAILHVLERTPPELVSDISKNAILLTGGGSLIWGLDQVLSTELGIKTQLAEDALTSVVSGTGQTLGHVSKRPKHEKISTQRKSLQQ